MSLFFELHETVGDFASKLGLMKHTEAADNVKIELDRHFIIHFITQC